MQQREEESRDGLAYELSTTCPVAFQTTYISDSLLSPSINLVNPGLDALPSIEFREDTRM
jgi:hypothetical protein